MKKIFNFCLALLPFLGLSSCKKITSIDTELISSVSIVNVVIGGNGVKINSNTDVIANNTFRNQSVIAGYVKVSDVTTNALYYNQSQGTENGGLYSLYLTGTASVPETVWIKDIIKPYRTDNSTTTVRVANMSPNAGTVHVSVASSTVTDVFTNISYKTVSEFKDFPLPLTIPRNSNVFQFKDASNNVIASFTLPASARNRSYTIVLKGLIGGSGSAAVGAIGQQHY